MYISICKIQLDLEGQVAIRKKTTPFEVSTKNQNVMTHLCRSFKSNINILRPRFGRPQYVNITFKSPTQMCHHILIFVETSNWVDLFSYCDLSFQVELYFTNRYIHIYVYMFIYYTHIYIYTYIFTDRYIYIYVYIYRLVLCYCIFVWFVA